MREFLLPAPRERSLCSRLARAGVCALLFWLVALIALVSFPFLQSPLVYLNWVRIPLGVDWTTGGEEFGFRAGTLRSFKVVTPDNVTLGGWHILPRGHAPTVLTTDGVHKLDLESASDRNERFDLGLKNAKRVFLYFHGNAGSRATFMRTDFYKMVQQTESHVVAIDYRGFADSDPVWPTEAGVRLDALTAFDWITSHGVDPSKIILVGHSLGTGIATYLAHTLTESRGITGGGLLLFAAYASIPDAALGYPMIPLLAPFRHHPSIAEKVKQLVAERWESFRNIRTISDWPVLIVHGSKDYEILPWQARSLFIAATSERLRRETDEPEETASALTAPDHPKGIRKYNGYQTRSLPGNEGWLWMSETADNGRVGDVWYLEVKHAGHNDLAKFQVVTDSIEAWTSAHGL
ncbi:Alpha/Beta hydrolase protein [Gaertneriomyces semiglobifer]|nr:Alpha/Beta hydrolase protein [Gaertneriomyces semiglobifer]